jgi:hypothetical protein
VTYTVVCRLGEEPRGQILLTAPVHKLDLGEVHSKL